MAQRAKGTTERTAKVVILAHVSMCICVCVNGQSVAVSRYTGGQQTTNWIDENIVKHKLYTYNWLYVVNKIIGCWLQV